MVSSAMPNADATEPRKHQKYEALIYSAHALAPVRVAVAHPCDETSLRGAVEAAEARIIKPTLVGPEARIRALAQSLKLDISPFTLVDAPHSHAAAAKAVELVRRGEADALMKGSLHTDELLAEVVNKDTGIRTERRISHVFIMDVPTYPKALFITDAAVNIFPTLEEKVDIVKNAIDLAHALYIEQPKVAILSAVETITSKIPSTIDAAALCKMADRGQITGALLDGPLALDNAINREAATIKHINSAVAGDADILLVPDLEAGNMLAKELTFLADADAAGIVLGARVPIILTSRADNVRARMASCAVAALYAHARRVAAAQVGKLAD
jgi:phosphate acetyltransferase